jgi:hypothetical protein
MLTVSVSDDPGRLAELAESTGSSHSVCVICSGVTRADCPFSLNHDVIAIMMKPSMIHSNAKIGNGKQMKMKAT